MFKKLGIFFRRVFAFLGDHLHSAVTPALKIVDILKAIAANPLLDIATSFIKGDLDDKILRIAREALPKVAEGFNIIGDAQTKTFDEVVKSLVDYVNGFPAATQWKIWHNFAVTIAEGLSDGHLTPSEIILAVESAFREKYAETPERAAMLDAINSASTVNHDAAIGNEA